MVGEHSKLVSFQLTNGAQPSLVFDLPNGIWLTYCSGIALQSIWFHKTNHFLRDLDNIGVRNKPHELLASMANMVFPPNVIKLLWECNNTKGWQRVKSATPEKKGLTLQLPHYLKAINMKKKKKKVLESHNITPWLVQTSLLTSLELGQIHQSMSAQLFRLISVLACLLPLHRPLMMPVVFIYSSLLFFFIRICWREICVIVRSWMCLMLSVGDFAVLNRNHKIYNSNGWLFIAS